MESIRQSAPEESGVGPVPVQQATGAFTWYTPPSGSRALPQMLPGCWQPVPRVQRLVEVSQSTVSFGFGAPPQQSSVAAQKLPVTRQPVAGAQMVAPVPTSTHVLEQQFSIDEQGLPSCAQPPEAPPEMNWQKPEPPSVTEQAFPQQSEFLPHVSPLAWQVYAGEQWPEEHSVEQHSLPPSQLSPSTSQVKVVPRGGAQKPLAQFREQHSALSVQATPSSVQDVEPHRPFVHWFVQHSTGDAQPSPLALQRPPVV